MVGVVGSSPIAPTNILKNIKHLAETLGAFFTLVRENTASSLDQAMPSLHENKHMTFQTIKKFGMAFLFLTILSAYAGTKSQTAHAKESRWVVFSDPQLGITFEHPPHLRVWRHGQDIYMDVKPKASSSRAVPGERGQAASTYRQPPQIDRALNGRLLTEEDNYLLHLTVKQGNFAKANAEHKIFVKGEDKKYHVAFGRFRNEPAHKLARGEWRGLDSTILCSTSDEETGFHAAGGWCYWALISNKSKYVLIDSQAMEGEGSDRWIRRVVLSIKAVKPAT